MDTDMEKVLEIIEKILVSFDESSWPSPSQNTSIFLFRVNGCLRTSMWSYCQNACDTPEFQLRMAGRLFLMKLPSLKE
jgi:hypothetical protein